MVFARAVERARVMRIAHQDRLAEQMVNVQEAVRVRLMLNARTGRYAERMEVVLAAESAQTIRIALRARLAEQMVNVWEAVYARAMRNARTGRSAD